MSPAPPHDSPPARAARPGPSLPGPLLLLALAAATGCGGGPAPSPADLVLRGGRVATVDSARPEARAVAVRGDTIAAVGSADEIERYVGPGTRVIDLEGGLAVPGFVESHGHFMSFGRAQSQLDLLGTRSWGEIVAKVDSAARGREPGEWILGRGWHQEKWRRAPDRTVAGFPLSRRLDEAAPENPVLLTHASGHAAIANRAALRAAGVGKGTRAPAGGAILRDAGGRPTGVLVDAAQGLVREAVERSRAEMSDAERRRLDRRRARLAARAAVEAGVTSFHDQGAGFRTLELYRRMERDGELPLRLYAMVAQDEVRPGSGEELAAHRRVGSGDDRVTVRAVGEITADGALGSRSAWMLEPYSDRPSEHGLNVTSMERVREIALLAARHGFQVAVHAIGDRANRETLDLYAALRDSLGLDADTLRWRIEHAQHLHPDDVPRFGELGVIAAMQGIHACSDAPYVVRRLGPERAREGAYMWKDLWGVGAVVTNGTDVPVEAVDPVASFYCTVTRDVADVPGVAPDSTFFPGQALDRARALRSYTLNGAYAAFQEDRIGSLEPGKLADVVVLSRDILSVPADSIPGTEVVHTIVGGEVVYSRAPGEGAGGDG